VVKPQDIKVSKSMRNVLNQSRFTVTFDQDFRGVMQGCADRPDEGTWITEDFIEAYLTLHELGFAHSVEARNRDGELVGGLYGVSLGRCFFGESMFARASNASKVAFITLARELAQWEFECIDCQIMNPHLESLGAGYLPRTDFLELLGHSLEKETRRGLWSRSNPSA
jgi:leucyl/phenylalanyl-tRNA--protein transferase